MDVVIQRASPLRGRVVLPADKALCHRALLLGSLTSSAVEITPWATGDDCRRTRELIQILGAPVESLGAGVRVSGVGLSGWRAPAGPLFCGDSGTTMRLLAGALAGQPFRTELAGGPSLSQRPMRRIVEPLALMGARIAGSGSGADVCPPLAIDGRRPLRGITYTPPVASAQVKSAILLAGLWADGPTTVEEPVPTRDHTERLLQLAGATVTRTGPRVTLQPPASLALPAVLSIPTDPSSAAFFLVAACLIPGSEVVIPDVSLNPTRIAFLTVLQRMGASLRITPAAETWEPRGTVTAVAGALRGTTVTAGEIPSLIDEIPILMVAACAAQGPTRFEGVGELKVKETDRLRSMTEGLRALGVEITVEGPAIVTVRPSRLRGGTVDSFGDHRTAMSLAVAGLLAGAPVRVRGAQCVAKSLEPFFELLAGLTAPGTVNSIDKG